MKKFVSFFCLLSLVGCSADDLPKYSDLGGLRVLALVSDNGGFAEYSPGDTVQITPWISDFKGGTRTIESSWQACIDPGITVGADPTCTGVPGATAVTTGAVALPVTERTGSVGTFSVSIPSTILDGRNPIEVYNGVNYLVTYSLKASDGATTASFKRLQVTPSTKTGKNRNPTLNYLLAGGTSLTTFPSGEVELRASNAPGSAESYTRMKNDGAMETRTEGLVTTWFITTGELTLFRTIEDGITKWTPGSRPTDHTPLVLGVTRDGRGGISAVMKSGL